MKKVDFFEVVKQRRSVRKYRSGTISVEDLHMIFEAAQLAPSAGNRQPWRFIVVSKWERKKALAIAADNQMFLTNAAVLVVALGDSEISERWYEKDTMIALEHMVLAAMDLGYGSCWIGGFNEEKVKRILRIPERLAVIAMLPIGVPSESPSHRPRKSLREIVHKEEYGKKMG